MTRMIERWFPCQEVSENSESGWGSGNSEANLFTWFAKRPLAQAKAAVLCSLLPWPDESSEQQRLQQLVRRALSGYNEAHEEITKELKSIYPNGCSILDPFSGRAMIPLEAARLGVTAWGIDYSPSATTAGRLLADYPPRRRHRVVSQDRQEPANPCRRPSAVTVAPLTNPEADNRLRGVPL